MPSSYNCSFLLQVLVVANKPLLFAVFVLKSLHLGLLKDQLSSRGRKWNYEETIFNDHNTNYGSSST